MYQIRWEIWVRRPRKLTIQELCLYSRRDKWIISWSQIMLISLAPSSHWVWDSNFVLKYSNFEYTHQGWKNTHIYFVLVLFSFSVFEIFFVLVLFLFETSNTIFVRVLFLFSNKIKLNKIDLIFFGITLKVGSTNILCVLSSLILILISRHQEGARQVNNHTLDHNFTLKHRRFWGEFNIYFGCDKVRRRFDEPKAKLYCQIPIDVNWSPG